MEIKREERLLHFSSSGNQTFTPVDMFLESDWSSASNFLVAGAIASMVASLEGRKTAFIVKKMTPGSSQADEAILDILRDCGAEITLRQTEKSEFVSVTDNRYNTRRSSYNGLCDVSVSAGKLKAFSADATDCPDLFPILATLAVHCTGQSQIKGVGRLENKESNRALSILQEFSRMGYDLYVEGDDLVIEGRGGKALGGGRIFCSSHDDHRIAMAVMLCGMMRNSFNSTPSELFLDDISCIDKSFPTFVERLKIKDK